jgi:hypothetical protein
MCRAFKVQGLAGLRWAPGDGRPACVACMQGRHT